MFIAKQGRYIPLFAAAVYDQNAFLAGNGYDTVNLTSAIIGEPFSNTSLCLLAHTLSIGNGMTEPASMVESYYDMTCTGASVFPVLPIRFVTRLCTSPSVSLLTCYLSTCVRMKKAVR